MNSFADCLLHVIAVCCRLGAVSQTSGLWATLGNALVGLQPTIWSLSDDV